MTRRSSGIHAAWHFWHAVSFGGEGGLRKVVLGGIHPLTQRYAPKIGFTSMLLWRIRIISIF
ncbi:TPA: DUF3265 domain-containing protein [Vibrio vulnificus]|nr:DUF3265 domain-containing protein [Vibrio vulnificus]AUJ35252.1 hypothetical protein BWZ32_10395 [Vibrio vulnificus]EGR0084759.1 DUF3265 domain-containing protein [Vibrio vulnificus]HAS6159168.1 DUF3265 domain-containing protein [Vibrio vulnificus]